MLKFLLDLAKDDELELLTITGRKGEIGKISFNEEQQVWEIFAGTHRIGISDSFSQAVAALEEYDDYNFI